MRIVYTHKAQNSLKEIANYLKENDLELSFIKNHLEEIRFGIKKLLTIFPEAGVEMEIDFIHCRRIMVKKYSVLYRYIKELQTIQILLIYSSNEPTLGE